MVLSELLHCIDDEAQSNVKKLVQQLMDWTFGWLINLVFLQTNKEAILKEMRYLQQAATDVGKRTQTEAAQPGREATPQVEEWMKEVEILQNEVNTFQEDYQRFPVHIMDVRLSHTAYQLLKRAREVKQRGSSLTQESSRVLDTPPAVADLNKEVDQLQAIRKDLLREVEVRQLEDARMKRTHEVEDWQRRADAVIHEVQLRRNSVHHTSEIKEDDDVLDVELLKKVRDVTRARGDITELVARSVPDAVPADPSSSRASSLVGRETTLTEIRRHLRSATVRILGIHGMAGVGKTALLEKIYHEMQRVASVQGIEYLPFDVVIGITVSRSANVLQIQRDIGNRLGLNSLIEDEPSDVSRRDRLVDAQAQEIFRVLSKKKYLLLLDDIWEELQLHRVGIPNPCEENYNKCKIAFTTRSEEVCNHMLSQCWDETTRAKVRVPLLDEGHARELFWRSCGNRHEVLANPQVRPLAEEMIRHCDGLPLTLLTLGKTMAGRKLSTDWEHAARELKNINAKGSMRAMKEQVLRTLKFSYDRLEEETMRQCLIYCSLFPESEDIPRKIIIDYWAGEGLLDIEDDGHHSIHDVRNKGHYIIQTLQFANLLEKGFRDEMKMVRLHDSVRDMALWLTGREAEAGAMRFISLAHRHLTLAKMPSRHNWAEATKISLMHNHLESLPDDIPTCPKLTTLLAAENDPDPVATTNERGELTFELGNVLGCKLSFVKIPNGDVLENSIEDLRCRALSIPLMNSSATSRKFRLAKTPNGDVLEHSIEDLRCGAVSIPAMNSSATTSTTPTQAARSFSIPPAFFRFTGALCVLDLSSTWLECVPPTIGLLGQLQYLNLSETKIQRLPKELGKLSKLKQLDLSTTSLLEEIPQEAISTLKMLQVLNLYDSRYRWPWGLYRGDHDQGNRSQACLRCLEGLPGLGELGICLGNPVALRRLASSGQLSESVVFLSIKRSARLTVSNLSRSLVSLTALQELCLEYCPRLEHLEFTGGQPHGLEVLQLRSLTSLSRVGRRGLEPLQNLRRLHIVDCPNLRDIAWSGTLPSLQEMQLYDCPQMEELLPPTEAFGEAAGAFPQLREMHLLDLPRLRRICRRPVLSFCSLQMVSVHRCPELKELSLRPDGGSKIQRISGAQEWWDALEWEMDQHGNSAEPRFSRKFTPMPFTIFGGQQLRMRINMQDQTVKMYPILP